MNDRKDEEIKCPDVVPEDQKGMTEEEREWSVKAPPKPRVPRYVFTAAAVMLAAAFAGGGLWYYRTNVMPEKYNLRAEALMKDGNYAQAEELYEKIIKIRPERRDVLFNIAACREGMGDAEGAITFYEEHLKTAKNDARAMTRLGWLYMKKGDYVKALHWFQEGVRRDKKNEELWRMTADAARGAEDAEAAGDALMQLSKLCKKDNEKVLACAKELLALKDYRRALEVFGAAAKGAGAGDARALHGAAAVKAMLGLPTEEKFVIRPGESLGLIKLGAGKEEVKEAMGGAPPEEKSFGVVGGKSMMAEQPVEIWLYNKGDPRREIRLIFIANSVNEIETASPAYKTEEGLGVSNFLLPKNKDKIKWRRSAENGTLLCLAKGGGLTFYASGLNEEGTEAERKLLRVHKGETGIDNLNDLPLLRLVN